MLLIPAIDLKDGKCVRLEQGDMNKSTLFSDEPVEVALKWQNMGARTLHLVDLNGAFAGSPQNRQTILDILQAVSANQEEYLPIQIGGGIRDLKTIEYWLDVGVHAVIIGTAAIKDPIFFKDACQIFAGHIIVGLDAKDGMIATDGWSKITKYNVIEMAKRFEDYGVNSIIYTDIGRDGMLKGINIEATVKLANSVNIPIIASGGLANIKDIEELCSVQDEGIYGVICGRAIYTGNIDFAQAQELADELCEHIDNI
jgi:phosphoribosylformimino-5-aminoimidazole carboxamide ribotide isomerase